MLTLHTLAAVTVTLSGAAAGLMLSRELTSRGIFLRGMSHAAEQMKDEIASLSTPLPELFERMSRSGPAAPFFARVRERFLAHPTRDAEAVWAAEATEAVTGLFWDDAALPALLRLGEGLGCYGLPEQVRRIGAAGEELRAAAERAEETARRYGRLCRFGGFALGLSAALLL